MFLIIYLCAHLSSVHNCSKMVTFISHLAYSVQFFRCGQYPVQYMITGGVIILASASRQLTTIY
uniref:Uncharacterized protein n=1 Tax=Arundo donax TaxID=35708 RepID=A0A0A9FGV1_ARUDO